MAFGFGFNKQKVLSAAEKFVQQGKLQNAIAEYEKVLKNDPKDLTVMNTVGDLYSRDGQAEKALECFKNVGDAYATQGFTVKAIAMYKKLTKLKPTLEGVLRLAELYTQQGLFNDARAQYLQVAEEFLRAGELEQAVRIFQKTLEMDPENVAMKMRLADVYVRLGKKTEAWQIFAAAAESLISRGSLPQAEEILQRMLTLDPGNSYALLLRGRTALDSGDTTAAIQNLERVADLDSHPDGMRTLMRAYLQVGRIPDVGTLANKLFTVHNDVGALTGYVDALMGSGQFDEALSIYQQYADRLLATDAAKVLDSLHTLIGHLRENTVALEALLELFHKAGDTSHVTEVYELLAHAYVQSGQLEKARDYYLKLTQLEPQNQLHARNYQQVLSRLGGTPGSRLITAEEGAVMVDELEATAAPIDQRYADEVALAVRAALTDAELFVSYNMPAKALGPLMAVMPQAPRDVRLNQRLAALHTRAERFAEAAVCCRTLESVYHDAGHPDDATRYGELAGKYEERASTAATEALEPEEVIVSPAAKPAAAAGMFWHATSAPQAAPHDQPTEFDMSPAPTEEREIDLSEEWEGEITPESAAEPVEQVEEVESGPTFKAPAAANEETIAETVEEIRFYLAHSMGEQARAALTKLEQLTHDRDKLAAMRDEVESALAHSAPEPEIEEVYVDEEPPAAPEPSATKGSLDEFVADLESSLGNGFLPGDKRVTTTPPKHEPEPVPEPVEYASAAPGPEQQTGELGEFVADLESALGDGFLAGAPQPEPEPAPRTPRHFQPEAEPETVPAKFDIPTPLRTPQAPSAAVPVASTGAAAAAAPAMAPTASPAFTYQPTKIRPLAPQGAQAAPPPAAGVDLAEMFGELKQDLEEDVAKADEDPETHYNLGVAFREMGLLDEAIGELQKVCQAVERGHAFPQIMQTYTWLAQCFLDKGVPEAAIRWYENALKLAGIDQETRTALHYELASAYEAAQDKPHALQHFMEVYGSNIDYRDVAERIKALKS